MIFSDIDVFFSIWRIQKLLVQFSISTVCLDATLWLHDFFASSLQMASDIFLHYKDMGTS